jgi:hypothetical protein
MENLTQRGYMACTEKRPELSSSASQPGGSCLLPFIIMAWTHQTDLPSKNDGREDQLTPSSQLPGCKQLYAPQASPTKGQGQDGMDLCAHTHTHTHTHLAT